MQDQLIIEVQRRDGKLPSLLVTRKTRGQTETVGLTVSDAVSVLSRGERPEGLYFMVTESEFRQFRSELAGACDEWLQCLGDGEA